MRLKNRFKNRFKLTPIINAEHFCRIDYLASDFKSGVIACLANPNFRKNWSYIIKQQIKTRLKYA